MVIHRSWVHPNKFIHMWNLISIHDTPILFPPSHSPSIIPECLLSPINLCLTGFFFLVIHDSRVYSDIFIQGDWCFLPMHKGKVPVVYLYVHVTWQKETFLPICGNIKKSFLSPHTLWPPLLRLVLPVIPALIAFPPTFFTASVVHLPPFVDCFSVSCHPFLAIP